MKTVYYVSNRYSHLFPDNGRSRFVTWTLEELLDYVGKDPLEVAVKSITFDNSRADGAQPEETLALSSNLIPSVISSYGYADIVTIFTVRKAGPAVFDFHNPTFFKSSKELLSTASFQIQNITTGEVPDFGIGFPTVVEVVVRPETPRMKAPFQILMDSSCPHSKSLFPSNTNSDFVTQLPQRLDFQKDWIVCLKSIHFSNEINTITDCWMRLDRNNRTLFKLEDMYETRIENVIEKINRGCAGYATFSINSNKQTVITPNVKWWVVKEDPYTVHNDTLLIEMSPNLTHLLGFKPEDTSIFIPGFVKEFPITSVYNANIFALQPKQFIVVADIVEHSVLGGDQLQILKYFVVPQVKRKKETRIDVDFSVNDYKAMCLKSFDRIHVRIMTPDGRPVQSNLSSPTHLQLSFLNINSSK